MNATDTHSRYDSTKSLIQNVFVGFLPVALSVLVVAGCASGSKSSGSATTKPKMDPAALALLKSSSDKLGAAKTLEVTAMHQLDPKLGLGLAIDEGRIELTVRRPNQFYANQPAGAETREIAYDGHQLCVMHPGQKNHALESFEAKNVEEFAVTVDERFGFHPPVAELLASNMSAEILIDVTSAKILKREKVGGTECDHLLFEQVGMTTDLWLGVDDKLPRRLLTTITDMPENPKWNIVLSGWKLDKPVDEKLFTKRPAADSIKVQMLRSN